LLDYWIAVASAGRFFAGARASGVQALAASVKTDSSL